MNDLKQFSSFKIPEKANGDLKPKIFSGKKYTAILEKIQKFYQEKLANKPFILKLTQFFNTHYSASQFNGLSGIKKGKSLFEKINLALTILLVLVLFFSWKQVPRLLAQADQLHNDLSEQTQVIEMENKNNEFLKKLDTDRNTLVKNINTVYSAVPDADEKAEEIIAMFEDVGYKNRMTIDAIGIRELPETQFFYDDLVGVVQVYEYNFAVESGLPNILSFMESIRKSLRLMDIMSMDIEEGKDGLYKATFSVYTYHLTDDQSQS